jgi:leucyl aminopeptidase
MEIRLAGGAVETVETDALVVLVFDKERAFGPRVEGNAALTAFLKPLLESGDLPSKLYETAVFQRPEGLKARRLLAIGAGKQEKFGAFELRRAAGTAVRTLKSKAYGDVVFLPDGVLSEAEAAAVAVEGAIVADFDPGVYKSEGRNDKHLGCFRIAAADTEDNRAALRRAQIVAESQNFARELINEPGNYLTPTALAQRAGAMASSTGLLCDVLDRGRCQELKMGAFLSVAQGSAEPPAFIVLKHLPAAAPAAPVLGLVGKGVTFDTGGISIKPAENMDKMKYDMAGGAAMIAAMRAIAVLQPQVRVLALVPATENMPGSQAQKPGDIRTAMSGKTIEIINTDAEGRLILADALHYARTLGCTHLVDAATLTGAIGIALGQVNAGAFTNNPAFQERVLGCARRAGERIWPMPMDDDYMEQIKGTFGDLLNTGGRYGGAITAAMFLRAFAEDTPWVHLDIAGTAWVDDNKPYQAKGASGFGVRTLVELVTSYAG